MLSFAVMAGPVDIPPTASQDPAAVSFPAADHGRLWTPWRMRYVGGGAGEPGCLFCRRLAADDDARSLILHRGRHAFAIMNLYPYNTGHLMLVPNEHAASPEGMAPEALAEMAALVPPTLRSLRRVLGCDGFNLGMNVGAIAGAGVADHLHEHVVPRWAGDANFMPILAATMVMPELIPATYAKARADLARELGGGDRVVCVVLADGAERVLATAHGADWRLPRAVATADEPLWRAARRTVESLVGEVDLIGWAGPARTTEAGCALLFTVPGAATDGWPRGATARWLPTTAPDAFGPEATIVARARANASPLGDGR